MIIISTFVHSIIFAMVTIMFIKKIVIHSRYIPNEMRKHGVSELPGKLLLWRLMCFSLHQRRKWELSVTIRILAVFSGAQ
jgi:hypothetical protein